MKHEKLAEDLEGLQTVESIKNRFGIDRARAIYLIHRLREKGYVKTFYLNNKKRMYSISILNQQKGISYTEFINKSSPIKLAEFNFYFVHGREPSPEEALIYALKRKTIRYVIASLSLFRKIKDWHFLYKLAKKENLVRQIAALYEVARLYVKKIRRIPKRFYNLARPKKGDSYLYIIERFSSDDFKDIEKKWRVYIPLNRADLREYKGIILA